MATIKSYTDISQSKTLSKILPLESADMWYDNNGESIASRPEVRCCSFVGLASINIPCWSLAALLGVLPEINDIPLTLEKVKAEDGYEGYYYHIEYKDKILIPYSNNAIDACYEMILKLHELNLL